MDPPQVTGVKKRKRNQDNTDGTTKKKRRHEKKDRTDVKDLDVVAVEGPDGITLHHASGEPIQEETNAQHERTSKSRKINKSGKGKRPREERQSSEEKSLQKKFRVSKHIAEPNGHPVDAVTEGRGKDAALPVQPAAVNETRTNGKSDTDLAADDESATADPARQKKRDRRERKKAEVKKAKEQGDYRTSKTITTDPTATRVKHKKEHKQSDTALWTVSDPIGGSYIDADPVFTRDQKHIIIATEVAVLVYSTTTSLLAQYLPNQSSGSTMAYCISMVEKDVLFVATSKNHVLKWDITSGKRLGRWAVNGAIHGIQAVQVTENGPDTLFIVEKTQKGWSITAHRFGSKDDPAETALANLLNFEKSIRSLQVIEDGKFIVAATADGLLLGNAVSNLTNDLKAMKFAWNEMRCAEAPTCLTVRVQSSASTKIALKPGGNKTVDVVVGGTRGCVYLFCDVFNRLGVHGQQNQDRGARIVGPFDMHWHRDAVGSVAWSKDGNYVISGGKETVLVLWQLETGRKQFLPHLEAAIRSVVVSPDGASYAVRLGDNSLMILSTSELTPTANVVGLQALSFASRSSAPDITRVDSILPDSTTESYEGIACAINPANPNRLLVAVPGSQPEGQGPVSAPYLQTFDIPTSRHVARQALARVNATNMNVGPEGNKILEPNVKLVETSSDGKWLATVDEWTTPQRDAKDLSVGDAVHAQDTKIYDVQLKFWSWNAETEEWMLNSRIAVAHAKEDSHKCERILDITADPSSTRFATLGTDAVVRVWRLRRRNVTGETAVGANRPASGIANVMRPETWWTLDFIITLPMSSMSEDYESVALRCGKLRFSADGSVLAVYQRFDKDDRKGRDVLHFIDADRRDVQQARAGLFQGEGIHDFGFLDRYLVCVGREKYAVWDSTTFALISETATPLLSSNKQNSNNSKTKGTPPLTYLAIDASSNTFAVAVPELSNAPREGKQHPLASYSTHLYLFSPTNPSKFLFEARLPHATLALMPAGGKVTAARSTGDFSTVPKGYLLLDAGACIRTIRPNVTRANMSATTEVTEKSSKNNIAGAIAPTTDGILDYEVDSMDVDNTASGAQTLAALFAQTEDSRPVVRTQELANVLDYPSHAMPSMTDLFKNVLSLYAGKP